MSFSVPLSKTSKPLRRIASNKLLSREGITLHPLVELDDRGEVVRIITCPEPDREPYTEFYAGLLVIGLTEAAIEQLQKSREPLTEWLPAILTDQPLLHLVTGLNYSTLCPTPDLRIQRIR